MELEVDGKKVYASPGGREYSPDGSTALFVHGSGMDHSVWALQARFLAHHGRAVLAVDLPGHGRSEGPPLGSMEELGAWVISALDAAGAEKAALVGHSMGALVTLEAAAQAPDRVSALALLGCATAIRVHPALVEAAKAQDVLAYHLMASWGHDRRVQIGGHQTPGLWMMGGSIQLLERGVPGTLYTDFVALNAYDGGPAAAAKVRAPTLLVIAEHDVMTRPAESRELARLIEGCRTVTIPCSGHLMLVERPDAATDALRDFLLAF